MNALGDLAYGFSVAFVPQNLLAALLGAIAGTFVGVLPGLGPVGALAILLTATAHLRPETALIMLAGIYYGSMYGGSTTSILMNVPGEAASVITCLDGYQMAKKGRAGAALAVAAVGSFFAGTIGILGLMLFAPVLANWALSFGPAEYFAICLLGLCALSRVSSGSFWKNLAMVALGLVLASVGMDVVSGTPRFTFGIIKLFQGIDIIPVIMGLFGLAEVFAVAEQAGGLPQLAKLRFRQLFPTLQEWQRAAWPIVRGSGLGFFIGLIPGPAAVIASFSSYSLERGLSKHPKEFGQGAIEGVAGPESANNAASSGAMVPLLGLGIPFSPVTAVLLAALMIQGIQPGPLLVQEHPEIFWGVVASMYIGNFMLLILNFPLLGVWVSLLRVPQPILLALIVVLILVGTYSVNNSLLDLVVLITMGLLGYVLKKFKFDTSPLILGMVLGPMLEKSFRQSMYASQGNLWIFFERPISAVLLVALVSIVVLPVLWRCFTNYRFRYRRI